MSDTEKKTINAIVKRNFTDAGTGRSFTASSKPIPIEEGAFINYEAADLVEFAPELDAAPAEGEAAIDTSATKGRTARA